MTKTRAQCAKEGKEGESRLEAGEKGATEVGQKRDLEEQREVVMGEKRNVEEVKEPVSAANVTEQETGEPPSKRAKVEEECEGKDIVRGKLARQTGVIERGHIYFLYRLKVQVEEAHSIDDVQRLLMLLIPRPPRFAHPELSDQPQAGEKVEEENSAGEMEALAPGADAIPAASELGQSKKHYRLLVVGKKHMPNPESEGRKQTFWATVVAVGDDLRSIEEQLGEKTYETKTRGSRHVQPVRLAASGLYAIVNNNAPVPSRRNTHFGYCIWHPEDMGQVQDELGFGKERVYVLQVKNPLAPSTVPGMRSKGADYPDEILKEIFGKGKRGREGYGLRFASCDTPELLEYEGAEVILIAARSGEEGLEKDFGSGRGKAMTSIEAEESSERMERIYSELAMDSNFEFPADPLLEGKWI